MFQDLQEQFSLPTSVYWDHRPALYWLRDIEAVSQLGRGPRSGPSGLVLDAEMHLSPDPEVLYLGVKAAEWAIEHSLLLWVTDNILTHHMSRGIIK